MSRPLDRRSVFAFALYDWANSAYSTLSITVLVTYLQKFILPGKAGEIAWGWGLGGTMFLAALASPIVGAMADVNASKRRWLATTTFVGSLAACLMCWVSPDRPWLFVALFLTTSLAFELAQGFYNAFLPEIADDEQMGRVSAWGYGAGYVGGGIALALAAVWLSRPTESSAQIVERLQWCLLLMGLWWGGFGLLALVGLKERAPQHAERTSLIVAARQATAQVRGTLTHLRQYRMLALFLLGFLFFNDGVQTVISQASVFGTKVLEMQTGELAQIVLMIQFVALPGSLAVGWLADRIGQKPTLLGCLAVWTALLIAAFFVTTKPQFLAMAFVAALVLGGTQSVSRTIMGLMTPAERAAEFFGFFNLSGRATSMFGPVFFSTILAATGRAHLALLSLLIFFVIGTLFVLPLDLAVGRKQARG
jgi:UMF1 family MFS transporter